MVNFFSVIAPGLCMVGFLYCFIFVDAKGKGPQAKVKRFLYEGIPGAIKGGLRKCCGDKAVWALERITSYVCYEANPAIQCMYVVMAGGGYYGYFFYGLVPFLPNPYLSDIHTYISIPFMFTCYWTYYKACSTNPGYHKKDGDKKELERAVKRYPCDKILFSNTAWCSTCDIPKPARSKHCSLCGACVEKYDHHCVWVNACVGLHNYKWFILFLLSHTFICIYGVYIGYYVGCFLVDEGDLWNKVFSTPNG